MLRTAKVRIDAGEYDCSALVHESYKPSGVLSEVPWLNTYMEDEILLSHGFVRIPVSDARRGDVLWRSGHTEMHLGNDTQGGARIDESGTIYGRVPGDQTGWEISKSAFEPHRWTRAYRYVGGHEVNHIPAAEVAAQIFEHVIDHAQHGYSQPNSRKNQKFETIEIRWDDGIEPTFEEDEMHIIISIKGRNTLVYYDGSAINDLTHPDDVSVLNKLYKACTNRDMPRITLTEEEFARLCQSVKGGYPKHLKAIVDKYPTRSPE